MSDLRQDIDHVNRVTKSYKCEYYTPYELKNHKSMVIDCIWYKQTKHGMNQNHSQCEFCGYYYEL